MSALKNENGRPFKGVQGLGYLTSAQASSYLAISEGSLRNWRSEGKGPAYLKIGTAVRYALADLDSWALAQRVVPAYV